MAALDRYRWAVDILDIRPDDIVLEIGCGYGHSIPLVCERLTNGRLTGIDRSEKMVDAALKASFEFLDSGRVEILHRDLLNSDLPASSFDKIFLFNINVFWMDPVEELEEIGRLLKPDGQFYLFHRPPPGHDLDEFENAFRLNLAKYAFSVIRYFKDQGAAVRSVALIAKPNRQ